MGDFLVHLRDHASLSLAALAFALAAGIGIGTFVARVPRGRPVALGAMYVARVVPSLAVLALMLPLVGVGFAPAVIALALLGIPPIAINTELGLRGVPFAVRDAARGLGLTEREIRARIDWPLALPVVFTGIRTAAVEVVASATLAAFVGGGGLGEFIVNGIASGDARELLEGAVAVGLLALAVDAGLARIERTLATPRRASVREARASQ